MLTSAGDIAFSSRRRRVLGDAPLAMATAEFAAAEVILPTRDRAHGRGRPHAEAHVGPYGPLQQIDAGDLSIGYAQAGPEGGVPVILLHGWPYDIHSFVEVAPLLAREGHHVIVPHPRGHGTTRFRSAATGRNGQPSALALDIVALMDALDIEKAILAGFDGGARTAEIVATLWPERCAGIVSASGTPASHCRRGRLPVPPNAELAWWYQYYFATERGREGLQAHRREIARLVWETNSPGWKFDDATFDLAAASFDNPDYVDVLVHGFRSRLRLTAGAPRYDALESRLALGFVVAAPAITLDGDADGIAPATDGACHAARFVGRRSHRIVHGAGHNLPLEAPDAFADAILQITAS